VRISRVRLICRAVALMADPTVLSVAIPRRRIVRTL
jgi:hypothetical protein